MKVFFLLAAVCGTVLGSPQSPISSGGSSNSSSISNENALQIAGLLTNIHDLLGERAYDLPDCQFPFIYMNSTYSHCTTDHDSYGMFWCSTKTDEKGEHLGPWRHCQLSEGNLFLANVDSLGPGPPTCDIDAIPFGMDQCLKFSAEDDKRTWIDALDACKKQSGRLATLRHPIDVGEYLATNASTTLFWSGASDSKMEGSWVWTDGEPIDNQFPWDDGEPSSDYNKDCQVVHDRNYSAADCTIPHHYICDMAIETTPCSYRIDCLLYGGIGENICCPEIDPLKSHENRFCEVACGKVGHHYCCVPPINATIT